MRELSGIAPDHPEPGDGRVGRRRGGRLFAWLQDMWAGEMPLGRVFWEYAIAYGSALNFLMSLAALAALSGGDSAGLALALHFSPVPYNVLMLVAVWRSADRYSGSKLLADVARGVVIVWFMAASVVL